MPKPSAADTSASNRFSVSSCQMMRFRDAPIASRMPISRWRATAAREQQVGDVRAPDQQDQAERKEERHEQQDGLDRQRDRALPRFEREARGGSLAGALRGAS